MTIHRRLIEQNLRQLRLLPLTFAHCRTRLHWCSARSGWNHADWGRIVFSIEYCFQLRTDDNRRDVWRRPGQLANRTFPIARHTSPQPRVMYPDLIFRQDSAVPHTARVAIDGRPELRNLELAPEMAWNLFTSPRTGCG
ncbi:HTH_Tnp_Tc3_2 domain-containing protein [Trichonephila clavipes]|nr:HTH_Tnp_Tc3_2 domain-containing protein [Trichonephila clavipes]